MVQFSKMVTWSTLLSFPQYSPISDSDSNTSSSPHSFSAPLFWAVSLLLEKHDAPGWENLPRSRLPKVVQQGSAGTSQQCRWDNQWCWGLLPRGVNGNHWHWDSQRRSCSVTMVTFPLPLPFLYPSLLKKVKEQTLPDDLEERGQGGCLGGGRDEQRTVRGTE